MLTGKRGLGIDSSNSTILWPLEKNYGISSTFGEYRTNRLHAGIDIKTNGQTGLKVFAVNDGEIFRIKVKRSGYGRALYIRHNDGTVSVYGHLEKFEETVLKLESIVKKFRDKYNSWYINDIYPKVPIPVKRGQVIAYSGESGAGLPHLHLEIRKNETEPYNPLLLAPQFSDDSIAPDIKTITITPASPNTIINGKHKRIQISLKNNKQPKLTALGPISLSVETKDNPGSGNKCEVYEIKLRENNILQTKLLFDSFSYNNHREGGVIHDISASNLSPTFFTCNLTGFEGTTIPVIKKSVPFLEPDKEINRLALSVSDVKGNEKHINFSIYGVKENFFKVTNIRKLEKGQYLVQCSFNYSNDIEKFIEAKFQFSPDRGKHFNRAELISVEGSSLNASYILKPNTSDNLTHFRARAEINSIPTRWHLKSLKESNNIIGSAQLSQTVFNNFVLFSAEVDLLPGKNLQLATENGKIWTMDYSDDRTYEKAILASELAGIKTIYLRCNGKTVLEKNINIFKTAPHSQLKISLKNFELNIPPNAAFSEKAISLSEEPSDNYGDNQFYPVGNIFKVEPYGLSFKKPFKVKINNTGKTDKVSIYKFNKIRNKWYFCGNREDHSGTSSYYITSFRMFADHSAPKVLSLFPKRDSDIDGNIKEIYVKAKDIGTGIDYKSVKFKLNNINQFGDYDGDRGKIFMPLAEPLKKGNYTVNLTFSDFENNNTSVDWNFTVK